MLPPQPLASENVYLSYKYSIFQESFVHEAFLSLKKNSIFEILMAELEPFQYKLIFPSWFIGITSKVTEKLETFNFFL